ncbi:MAG TPA: SDR family oxidoreductase, partial [Longimicrobiaceae bacterium]|nr:SDR family oxidoreductase [Longimicrobiaceae bacterium]
GAAAPAGGAIDFRRMVGRGGSAADALDRTLYAHPAVFVVEYALARLWMSWGVRPEAMIGYSVGEYVAAALSGVLSLEDALMLVAGRARLVDGLPAGALLAVPLSEDELAPHLGEGVSLMAVNGPALCVAAGDEAAVAALEEALRARGVVSRRLRAGHAFHSRMMEPAAAPFRELLRGVALGAPGIPYVSTVTGGWIRPEEAADPELWVRHLVRPVRFSEGLGTLAEEPSRAYLEVGPGRTLGSFAAQLAGSPGRVVAPSLRAAYETADDPDLLLGSLGRLWLAGVPVDWRAFHAGEERRRVPAPTYPFERERFLVGPGARPGARAAAPRPPAKGRDMAEWFYQPVWRQARVPVAHLPGPVADPDGEDAPWLLLADGGRIGELLAERLREGGRRVLTVRPGAESGAAGEDAYTLQPDEPRGYLDLLRALRARGAFPRRIVHLWGAEPAGTGGGLEGFEREQERVLHPLLYLAQALGREALSESVRLWVVTAGAQAVESRDVPHPGRATVLAPCRVIGQEYPNVTCRAVDLAEDALEGPAAERAVGQLLTEVSHPLPDLETAYRGAQRWVRAFEPLRLEASAGALPIRLRRGGVYLITGGLGRIGLALAAHLARTADAKLALLGRTGVPPRDEWDGLLAAGDGDETVRERVRALRALESAGAEVLVLRGDAGSEADVREAVRAVRERFGALHGVVHAAGVAQGGMLRLLPETDVAELRRQFHPKVGGTYALHAALGDDPLDFCLLTSSLSPILGGLGFTAYASANLFLDAFAQSRHAAGDTRWTSINWADWESGEESGDAAAGIGATVAEFEMSTGEGVGTFERILSTSASLPQVVVSRGDLHQRLNQWLARERPADAAPADAAGEAAGHGRPELNNPYVAPRDETEERICAVWSEVLGVRPVGVYDNFFELGGHSLSGIQIVSRLREAFQVDLPLTALLTSPVVAEVALVIEELAIERVLSMSEDELRQLQ